jgi:N-ethylmaleimide reductase
MAQQLEILSKFDLSGLELRNRLVLAPMTRARCTPSEKGWLDPSTNNPNDLYVEHFSQRAGDAGLLITDATAVSEQGSGWPGAPHIRTQENVEGWKKVTDAVHAKGGFIFLQLWHMGRAGHSSFHPSTNKIVSASAIAIPDGHTKSATLEDVPYEVPVPLTVEEIKETVQDFVHASQLAKQAGFDGVEIHGANGYLIDQFLQSSTNQRGDEYGGSKENRIRLLTEIIEAIIADGSMPANRIAVRLSPNGAYNGMGSADNHEAFPYFAKELNKYGLAYLHIMDGLGFGFHAKCPVVRLFDIKKNFDGAVISNITLTKEIAEGIIRSGAADLVAFGRKYISNPDLAARFANDWPLNEDAPYETWWQHTGAKGYTDWPFYEEKKE